MIAKTHGELLQRTQSLPIVEHLVKRIIIRRKVCGGIRREKEVKGFIVAPAISTSRTLPFYKSTYQPTDRKPSNHTNEGVSSQRQGKGQVEIFIRKRVHALVSCHERRGTGGC